MEDIETQNLANLSDSQAIELLRQSLHEVLNNISVSQRMLINEKYQFKNLSEDLQNFDGCRAYIQGMEWAYKRLLSIQQILKQKKD